MEADTDTVFSDVELKRKGARRAIPIRGAYYHAGDAYEAFPGSTLRPATVYQVVVDCGRDGVRGVDGNVVWGFRTADGRAGRTAELDTTRTGSTGSRRLFLPLFTGVRGRAILRTSGYEQRPGVTACAFLTS